MADRPWSDPANARRDPTDNDATLGVSDPDGTPGNFLWSFPGLVNYLRSFFLENVVEDTSPQLGGNLETKGQDVLLTRSDDTIRGIVRASDPADAAILAYSRDGVYITGDGGIALEPSVVQLYGTSVSIPELKHALDGGRQVYVSTNGILYAVDPPPVGWTISAEDTGDYNLGTGAGQTQAWVELTALGGPDLLVPDDVEIGQRLDISVNLYVIHGKNGDVNDPQDKTSSLDIGFGIGGATPGPTESAGTASIGPYFSGWVSIAFSTTVGSPIASGTEIQIFARNGGGEDSASTIFAQYTSPGPGTGDGHEAVVSTPGAGSGAGGDMVAPGTMGTGNLYVSTADPKITADGNIAPIGLLQPSMTELTGTWVPARGITDPARVYSNDASFIVNQPSGDGAWEFLCGASCEPSVDGTYLQLGQRQTGKTQYAYLSLDSTIGEQIFAWGSASP